MGFNRRIKYFLVHTLKLRNKEAAEIIAGGRIEVDRKQVHENCILEGISEVRLDGKVVRPAKELVYIRFHKPPGYESTLNAGIENNLSSFFGKIEGLSIAGRLDKASEGLLLLSNDGKWVENITNPLFEKEKEYLVTLDAQADENFIQNFQNGVDIGNYVTKPCECSVMENNRLKIILKEGKNRQIRKMCKKLNYNVIQLKRIRVHDIGLGSLGPGEWDFFKV